MKMIIKIKAVIAALQSFKYKMKSVHIHTVDKHYIYRLFFQLRFAFQVTKYFLRRPTQMKTSD